MRQYQTGERDAQGEPIWNPEYAADTPARAIYIGETKVVSRCGRISEYRLMLTVVGGLPTRLGHGLREFHCDSKSCSDFALYYHGTYEQAAETLLMVKAALINRNGGYNAIWVILNGHDCDLYEQPEWCELLPNYVEPA